MNNVVYPFWSLSRGEKNSIWNRGEEAVTIASRNLGAFNPLGGFMAGASQLLEEPLRSTSLSAEESSGTGPYDLP